jgi:hypothetical protein
VILPVLLVQDLLAKTALNAKMENFKMEIQNAWMSVLPQHFQTTQPKLVPKPALQALSPMKPLVIANNVMLVVPSALAQIIIIASFVLQDFI